MLRIIAVSFLPVTHALSESLPPGQPPALSSRPLEMKCRYMNGEFAVLLELIPYCSRFTAVFVHFLYSLQVCERTA
jgi:hypothetical protein